MSPPARSLRRPVALVALAAFGGLVVTRVPTVSLVGTSVRTGFVVGLVAAVVLVPAVVSHWRSGESRQALQWTLFAVGIPLSLLQGTALVWLGVLAIFASVGVGRRVDRRIGLTPR